MTFLADRLEQLGYATREAGRRLVDAATSRTPIARLTDDEQVACTRC